MREPTIVNPQTDKFKQLYMKYAPRLIVYACNYVDMETSEDLVQEVFTRIWQRRDDIDLVNGMYAYLHQAVRHACMDHIKHLQIKRNHIDYFEINLKMEELSYMEDPFPFLSEDERIDKIRKEIDKLPEKRREIILLSYIEEKKASEIASLLDISKRTVESQLYKAIRQLRNAFFK